MSEHQKTLRYNNLELRVSGDDCRSHKLRYFTHRWRRTVIEWAEMNCPSEDTYTSKDGRCCDRCHAGQSDVTNLHHLCFFFFLSFFFFVWLWNHSVNITDCVLCLSIFLLCLHSSLTSDFISLFSQLLSGTYVQADCDGTKKTECVGCGRGLYTATKNHLNKCQKCKECSRSKWHGCMHMQYCIAHKRHILTSFSSAFL